MSSVSSLRSPPTTATRVSVEEELEPRNATHLGAEHQEVIEKADAFDDGEVNGSVTVQTLQRYQEKLMGDALAPGATPEVVADVFEQLTAVNNAALQLTEMEYADTEDQAMARAIDSGQATRGGEGLVPFGNKDGFIEISEVDGMIADRVGPKHTGPDAVQDYLNASLGELVGNQDGVVDEGERKLVFDLANPSSDAFQALSPEAQAQVESVKQPAGEVIVADRLKSKVAGMLEEKGGASQPATA